MTRRDALAAARLLEHWQVSPAATPQVPQRAIDLAVDACRALARAHFDVDDEPYDVEAAAACLLRQGWLP